MYNGVQHGQGETWEDGCTYDCVCEDAAIGKYTCNEKVSAKNTGQVFVVVVVGGGGAGDVFLSLVCWWWW